MILLACTLISITDGDTFKAGCFSADCNRYCVEQEYKVRIANIDAPEFKTCPKEAVEAKVALTAYLPENKRFTVQSLYTDRYGRIVGVVIGDMPPYDEDDLSAGGDANIGELMMARGFAKSWQHSDTGKALEPRPKGC